MDDRISNIKSAERTTYPGQRDEQQAEQNNEKSVAVTGSWNSGITKEDESVVITSCDSDDASTIHGFRDRSHTSEEFSSSEHSQSSDHNDQQEANRAAGKMNTASSSARHPSKFCLSGLSTSLGFSAAVAGFAATVFLYDLMTRFPEKATTGTGVAFGTSIVVALGGTITCSTSLVFLVRELCKTSPD